MRGKPRRILSQMGADSNSLQSQHLQDTQSVASTPASTLSPNSTPTTPNAETILAMISAMQDAERDKLLRALMEGRG